MHSRGSQKFGFWSARTTHHPSTSLLGGSQQKENYPDRQEFFNLTRNIPNNFLQSFLAGHRTDRADGLCLDAAMSTVADELLNDFGSSGDEAEETQNDGLIRDEAYQNGDRDAMDVDGEDNDESDEAEDGDLKDAEDTEATKAKVEKMQLGAVKDVRSVASLMATLEPVLEVSSSQTPFFSHLLFIK